MTNLQAARIAVVVVLATLVVLTGCTGGPSADERLQFANELGNALAIEETAELSSVDRGATSCESARIEGSSPRVGDGLEEVLEGAGFATSDGGAGVAVRRSGMVATVAANGSQVSIDVVDEGC